MTKKQTRTKRRMTSAEFDIIRPMLNISDERIEAAYSALVLGETLRVIAGRFGWSPQAVHDASGVVWRTFEKYQEGANAQADLPEGWEVVTLRAPKALADKFRAELAAFEKEQNRCTTKK